jgi:ABC-type antimicrobial peptide transport system permease subunit
LAAGGIYGIVSFQSSTRSREMAIRVAIGSSNAGVLRLVLRETLTLTSIGVLIGVPLAVLLGTVIGAIDSRLHASDALPFLGSLLLFVSVALLGALPSARRAASADPATVLRT